MIRALIVDDSATMRGLIAAVLSADPEIEVVGQAADPLQARERIKALNPDVITLDVEMPNMNGLEFLEKIMRLRPMPVVMVSTLTARGAEATLPGASNTLGPTTIGTTSLTCSTALWVAVRTRAPAPQNLCSQASSATQARSGSRLELPTFRTPAERSPEAAKSSKLSWPTVRSKRARSWALGDTS